MKQLVPETRHIENLCYLRELKKLEIDNWVEDCKNGLAPNQDEVDELILDLSTIEECMSDFYSKLKECGNKSRKWITWQ